MKKAISSPLFVPIVAAPVLFGLAALLLTLDGYDGAWYYVLYFFSHILTTCVFFFGLCLVFRACPTRGMPRALTAAIPTLVSLSVYHVAIAFFDAYVLRYEDGGAAIVYALLSLFTDSIVGEWLLLLLAAIVAYLVFLRGEPGQANKRAARLLAALLYFVYLSVGRFSEFFSYRSARLGIADETTTVTVLLFWGSDLLFAAIGYLVLFLSERFAGRREVNE